MVFLVSLTLTVGHLWMTHPAAPSPRGREPGCRGKTRHPWPELRLGKPFAGGQNTHIKLEKISKAQLCYQQTHNQRHTNTNKQVFLPLLRNHTFRITSSSLPSIQGVHCHQDHWWLFERVLKGIKKCWISHWDLDEEINTSSRRLPY